jgi:hypothetical protein
MNNAIQPTHSLLCLRSLLKHWCMCLMGAYRLDPIVQVIVVIVIMIPVKLVMKCILRRAYREKDDKKRIIRVSILP